MAKPYSYEIGFAYFAVNLGYSRTEYDDLTPLERALIIKEMEKKMVRDDDRVNRAVHNAIYNANRGKKPFRKLWRRRRGQVRDVEALKAGMQEVIKMEASDQSKSWVAKIYEANGLRPPQKKGETDGRL